MVAVGLGGPCESVVHGSTGWLCEPSAAAFADAFEDVRTLQTDAMLEGRGAAARTHVEASFGLPAFGGRLEAHLRRSAPSACDAAPNAAPRRGVCRGRISRLSDELGELHAQWLMRVLAHESQTTRASERPRCWWAAVGLVVLAVWPLRTPGMWDARSWALAESTPSAWLGHYRCVPWGTRPRRDLERRMK